LQLFWTYYIASSFVSVSISDKIAKHTYDWKKRRKPWEQDFKLISQSYNFIYLLEFNLQNSFFLPFQFSLFG
jgi:hypothetical protein